jgi:hypothetical protein
VPLDTSAAKTAPLGARAKSAYTVGHERGETPVPLNVSASARTVGRKRRKHLRRWARKGKAPLGAAPGLAVERKRESVIGHGVGIGREDGGEHGS